MKHQIILHKMRVKHEQPIQYFLTNHNDEKLCMNDFLNQKITLSFLNQIFCIQCGRKTNKSFQQGHCFPCMRKINECNNCMIHPEKCLVELHGCPHDDWAHTQCHAPHVVYFSNASGLKVGITRTTNQPSRWIDQGAIQALPFLQTSNRYQCGLVEVALKKYVADKTNWRAMLKNTVTPLDLEDAKKTLLSQAEADLAPIFEKYQDAVSLLDQACVETFDYPVLQYPTKVSSFSFDKTPEISGVLLGIKGQYLILDTGVLNIRKFGGYLVEMRCLSRNA